ncbi:MFS transporter [Candidatus Uhrbacteria bacterium]|nr:MFS transporter [Candidatus Uhrbacteria bacterium]
MNAPQHAWQFRLRRALNWLPLGLAYAFMYMGRYNLTVAQKALGDKLMPPDDFGWIFGIGAWVYALSFLINGPLTDRIGGRRAMLLGTLGTLSANALMGLTLYGNTHWGWEFPIFGTFVALYSLNMYFQNFGAIAIVTTKAPWFHVAERGTFSTIFGVIISLGIFFAFDWGFAIVEATRGTFKGELGFWASVFQTLAGTGGTGVNQNWWLFFAPSILLGTMWIAMALWLRNSPAEAGFSNFATGEATLSTHGEREPARAVFLKLWQHPVIRIVCLVEFCSGVLRNGVMHWYPMFAADVGFKKAFLVTANWGLTLLICGTIGAILTGWCSDKLFQSRRAPMAGICYGLMIGAVILLMTTLAGNLWYAGIAVILISTSVIGVHGIFSGTATADFAGTKNTGAAVGIVDGMVYLGTGLQAIVIGQIVPQGAAAKVAGNWGWWPTVLLPFTILGLILALRIWNAKPQAKATVVSGSDANWQIARGKNDGRGIEPVA